MNEYILPLGSPENFWRVDGREIRLTLLPKDEWIIEPSGDGCVVVGAYLSHHEAMRAVHFMVFEPSELPNALVTADDLESVMVSRV
jgi:hypothetical protein